MRVIIQRVKEASVIINGKIKSKIGSGLLIFLGIVDDDTQEDLFWICNKICNLRIFNDEDKIMNLSVKEIEGQFLVVSQFTLHASTKKGNRPSYIKAAKPDFAIPMYNEFIKILGKQSGTEIQTGEFGADMKVNLLNDGPVTIIIDSKIKE
jgi:D-tyrosyl-tRNA(Tyr) deacylase